MTIYYEDTQTGNPYYTPVLVKEYAYNSDVSATSNPGSNGALASSVSGTAGVNFSSNWVTGTEYRRRLRYSDANLDADEFTLEILVTGLWLPYKERLYGFDRQSATSYGPRISAVGAGSSDIDVFFAEGGYTASGATLGIAGSAWTILSTEKWRVRRDRWTFQVLGAGVSETLPSLVPGGYKKTTASVAISGATTSPTVTAKLVANGSVCVLTIGALGGLTKNGTPGSLAMIGLIPVGYRPNTLRYYIQFSNLGAVLWSIGTNGDVQTYGTAGGANIGAGVASIGWSSGDLSFTYDLN